MASIKQHESLRVPMGWKDQDKALIGQLERIFDDLYKRFGRLTRDDLGKVLNELLDQMGADIDTIEATMVTAVSYNAVTGQLTVTINGTTSNIVAVATLDGNGKVPASQLPSYVDDVEEYEDFAHFPPTGEADKIYVALDTGFTFRWSGSQYVRLNTYDEATQSASGLMSASDKTKLDGIEEHANNYGLPLAADGTRGGVQTGYTQNAKNYPVQLSSEKMYVNVPWTADGGNAATVNGKTVETNVPSGAVFTDTKNSTGTTNKTGTKLFVVGAETQATNPQTNSNSNVYIGTDNCLYSNGTKVLTSHQDMSGKADKVSGATNNNFAALDSNGNLKDSGHKHGDYLTEHQDISGKADKSATVSTVAYDSTNKKITKTINGTTTDVVTVATIKSALGSFTWGALAGQ